MDNQTFLSLYGVIDQNIKRALKNGSIKESEADDLSQWALTRLYQIQYNSKLKNAIKTRKILK